jgi:hypothetical protein
MTKFRGLVLVGLIGLLALCAPQAQAVVVVSPAVAAGGAAPAAQLAWPFEEQLAPPGPVLDPAGTAQANSQRTKNKLIAGGVAVVLLLLVIWGRKVRSKKATKISDQAKGK